jgi:hypothetical protein
MNLLPFLVLSIIANAASARPAETALSSRFQKKQLASSLSPLASESSSQPARSISPSSGCGGRMGPMRRDDSSPETSAPTANYGVYHEDTRTGHGPVDQVLEKTGGWRTYCLSHIPPVAGPWKFYVQLNGWGNFGRGVAISLDDISCTAARYPPSSSPYS